MERTSYRPAMVKLRVNLKGNIKVNQCNALYMCSASSVCALRREGCSTVKHADQALSISDCSLCIMEKMF